MDPEDHQCTVCVCVCSDLRQAQENRDTDLQMASPGRQMSRKHLTFPSSSLHSFLTPPHPSFPFLPHPSPPFIPLPSSPLPTLPLLPLLTPSFPFLPHSSSPLPTLPIHLVLPDEILQGMVASCHSYCTMSPVCRCVVVTCRSHARKHQEGRALHWLH